MNDQSKPPDTLAVLFVCLGNICRSPSAQGVFEQRLVQAGLEQRVSVDSAGTGDWHIGKSPDRRATAAAAARDIDLTPLRARQVTRADFAAFDYVLAMDHQNLADLRALATEAGARRSTIALFGDFSARYRGAAVPDPYFGGRRGFEDVLDLIEDASDGLIAAIGRRLDGAH